MPEPWDIWTADFPFSETKGEKHRTVLVLAVDAATQEVLAVKGTSSNARTVYAGCFAVYSSDSVYKQTGLHKDTKFDVNTLTRLPFDRFTKKIGFLDVAERAFGRRVAAAIMASDFYDQLRSYARSY